MTEEYSFNSVMDYFDRQKEAHDKYVAELEHNTELLKAVLKGLTEKAFDFWFFISNGKPVFVIDNEDSSENYKGTTLEIALTNAGLLPEKEV